MDVLPELEPGCLAPRALLASLMVCPPRFHCVDFPVPGLNMYLVVEGRMRYRMEGGEQGVAASGELVTFTAGRHEYEVLEGEPLTVYQTHFLVAGPPSRHGVPVLAGVGRLPAKLKAEPRMVELVAVFQRLMRTILEHGVAWEIESAACVLDLLQFAFKLASATAPEKDVPLSGWDYLLGRIDSRPEGMTVRQMAKTMGYSPEHFIREFKKRYGLAPMQYLQSQRLERARRMILDGMGIKAAAAASGFKSALHLNRVHKRYYRTPPSAAVDARPVEVPSPGLPVSRHIWAPGVEYADLAKML